MDRLTCTCSVALAAILLTRTTAYPTYPANLPNADSVACPAGRPAEQCPNGNVCAGLGHVDCRGGAVKAPDGAFLNAFGEAFRLAGYAWTPELCAADSDGDGASNGAELGDPCCVWTPGAASPADLASYTTSHPGDAGDVAANVLPSDADCAALRGQLGGMASAQQLVDGFFNPGEDQIEFNFTVEPHTLLPAETVYADFFFNLPDARPVYVVGIVPRIVNKLRVHHYVVNLCTEPLSNYTSLGPGVVNNPVDLENQGDLPRTCVDNLWNWAPGTDHFQLPADAAFRIEAQYPTLHLQVHYNNVDGVSDETDASGFTLYATSQPRMHNAGLLWTGSVMNVGVVPPLSKDYFSTSRCVLELKPECEAITVVGHAPHAHFLGRRIWGEHYSRDAAGKPAFVRHLGVTPAYSYDNQQMSSFAAPASLRHGDVVVATCTYDSDLDTPTPGGYSSQQEMCVNWLLYYPTDCVYSYACIGHAFSGTLPPGFLEPADAATPAAFRTDSIAPIAVRPDFAALATAGAAPPCDPAAVFGGALAQTLEASFFAFLVACPGAPQPAFMSSSGDPDQAAAWPCPEACAAYLLNYGVCAATALAQEIEAMRATTGGLTVLSAAPPQCWDLVGNSLAAP